MTVSLSLLLGVLATWRLARDYVQEEGPLGLYGRSRRALVNWAEQRIEASDVNDPRAHKLYWLYDGPTCLICMSFCSALLFSLLLMARWAWPLLDLPVVWLGLAGGALVVDALTRWLRA